MKIKSFIKKYIPTFSLVLVILAFACAVIHVTALISRGFAEAFSSTVGAAVRFILAKLTGWLPISFAEILIVMLPIILFLVIFFAVKTAKKGKIASIRYLAGLFSVITLIYSSFVLTFACAYRGVTLDEKLDLERRDVSAAELKHTTALVIEELNKYSSLVYYGEDRFSVMPYSFRELNGKLSDAYISGVENYPFLQKMRSNAKPILLSEPMTYTHISGVYTFFTGEANVNTNYKDYNTPFTMAHEMAHQRGIAREDEANFIAFLICIESEDDYIRYSAYLNMFEYLANALYKADKTAYAELITAVNINVRYELVAYSDYFDKYRDNVASDISGAVNNSYLISQGQVSGTKSYGLVVDLAVAYYLSNG